MCPLDTMPPLENKFHKANEGIIKLMMKKYNTLDGVTE